VARNRGGIASTTSR